MNYLQLVQALQEKSGAGGTPVATLDSVSGEELRLKNWIDEANLSVQAKWFDWKFLWADDIAITTGIGTADYAGPDNIHMWDMDTIKVDGTLIPVYEYDFESFPQTSSSGTPTEAHILPNNQIRFYPTPAAAHSITGEYWRTPLTLKQNDEADDNAATTIVALTAFDYCVIYEALMYLANWEGADEIRRLAREGQDHWWPLLEASQLPNANQGRRSDGNDIVIRAV